MKAPTRFGRSSGPLTALTFLSGVFGAIAVADGRFPRPGSPDEAVRDYYERNPRSAALSATGQLVSTFCLARFALTIHELTGQQGQPAARLTNAVGAGLAVTALATSAVTTARLRGPERHDARAAATLARRAFVAGGPVHGVGFGLMTAALVTAGHRRGVLGDRVAATGAAAAAAGVLSPSYFAAEPLGWLIPIGRFGGLALAAFTGPRIATATTRTAARAAARAAA